MLGLSPGMKATEHVHMLGELDHQWQTSGWFQSMYGCSCTAAFEKPQITSFYTLPCCTNMIQYNVH